MSSWYQTDGALAASIPLWRQVWQAARACWWCAGMVEWPEGEVGTGLGTGSRLAHHVDTLLASLDRLSFASVPPGNICASGGCYLSVVTLQCSKSQESPA